jgi:glycosyltransferase involved in cell wall biosynthesis
VTAARGPAIVVFSSLFPSSVQPHAGLFIRERMFRVGRELPLTVVAPVPWFPFQGVLRLWRPHFRLTPPTREVQEGIEVLHPRFFSVPGFAKQLDGLFMAIGTLPTLRRLRREGRLEVLDAHFAYPEGYAATLLGRWLGVPVTITLRGTESRHARMFWFRPLVRAALARARRVFAVADALKRVAVSLGIPEQRILVVGNGVDTSVFRPVDRSAARRALGLAPDAPVLVTVGGLVERKGFHRVIEQLPALRERFPGVQYLIVGGPSPEGDFSPRLREQVAALGLGECVRFLGALAPAELAAPLSASDVFVLATRNEGWANVLLEAMACGLPVVTTDVGGNAEVVSSAALGTLVPFGDGDALREAIAAALERRWDRQALVDHARANGWDGRVARIVEEFRALAQPPADARNLRVGASPR